MVQKLNFSSSDGEWNQLEWKKVRRLYEELWPGEPIWCPWAEVRGITENSRYKVDEEITLKTLDGVETSADNISEAMIKCPQVSETIQLNASQFVFSPGLRGCTIFQTDFNPIQQWLSQCEEDVDHDKCKHSKIRWRSFPGVMFRLIDVSQRCIVEATDDCSFIVLTYVWGGANQLKLTKDTMSLLMRKGGLEANWQKLPTTIRDAIIVCEKLQERYLWIDALCIRQDSSRDMKLQILRMRQIYAAAKCTIVAVSADTAEVGLLGSPVVTSACDSVDQLSRLIELSPWNSRAWCYQEKVLSHRAIFFTSSGIYTQCQNGVYNANGVLLGKENDANLAKFNTIGGMLYVPPGKDLEAFISAVEYYSQRKLAKQDDKINAFQGIAQRFKDKIDGKITSFLYGLPICAFDQTFCWHTRRHNPHCRNENFPSWSWLGWDDAILFDHNTLQAPHTNAMIHYPGLGYFEDIDPDVLKIRKPLTPLMHDNSEFGFPTALISLFYNIPRLRIIGSVAALEISPEPVESDNTNGLYIVFPTNYEETSELPLQETSTPLGYIWLEREWRKKQSVRCIMKFMVVAGKPDINKKDQWIATMIMCLRQDESYITERVQMMDCEVEEERWLKAGAKVEMMCLV